MNTPETPKTPVESISSPEDRGDDGRDIDRRTWLKQVGIVVTGAAVLPACEDDLGALEDADARLDAGADADLGAGTDAPADTGADADLGAGADADASRDIPGPIASLTPVRGDGTHPLHYVENIVIVQMENRSFDHYFGSLSLLEGRTDVAGLAAAMANPTTGGTQIPISRLDDAWIFEPDPSHSHNSSLEQLSGGTCQGFVRNWETKLSAETRDRLAWVMGYHTRDQLPTYYSLADAFTLCDAWHCSVLGPTWPNRFFSHAATSEGQLSNDVPITSPTAYSALMAAGGTFALYHQVIIYFGMLLGDPPARSYPAPYLDDFFEDAAAGRLPNVSVVEPDYTLNDDHPPQDIRLGQAFVHSIYEALRQSPQWDRTLMVVFYDEHGGFFDHVEPPLARGETRADQGFGQLGFRVPGLVIGPLARRGYVLHDTIEHSSVPSLVCNTFGLPHLNERARLAGDLSAALDLELTLNSARPEPPALPPLALSYSRMLEALERPCGQPELEAFARRRFGVVPESRDDKQRQLDRFLRRLDRLRVARIGS
jgi:phospholipase C